MKKLTIGQLSDFVGVAPSTMRFYESKGIVAPEKDSQNSYRAYTAPESCRILLSRLYQSFGFSLAETADLLQAREHGRLMSSLEERARLVEEELSRLMAIRDELRLYRQDCEKADPSAMAPGGEAQGRAGGFERVSLPAMRCIFTITSSSPDCEEERAKIARDWMRGQPLPAFIFLVPEGAFLGSEGFSSRWGFSLQEEAGEAPEDLVEAYPAGEALSITFIRKRADRIDREELEPIIGAFTATGNRISGPVWGRFLEILDTDQGERYLYRLFIPVKE